MPKRLLDASAYACLHMSLPSRKRTRVNGAERGDKEVSAAERRRALVRGRKMMWLAGVGFSVAILLLSVEFMRRQGIDPGTWLSRTWALIAAIPLPFLVAALLMKVSEVALNAFAWMNSLRAAFPAERISYRQMFGVVQGGVQPCHQLSVQGVAAPGAIQGPRLDVVAPVHEQVAHPAVPVSDEAAARSAARWILPLGVFGSESTKLTRRG